MATREQLKELARVRLTEAEALFSRRLYDGCVYLCGYVVEVALKARICRLLGVRDYPETRIPAAFRTHDFDHLKLLAGLETKITAAQTNLFANWSIATKWKPELRYEPPGRYSRKEAQEILEAVRSRPNGVLTWLSKRW